MTSFQLLFTMKYQDEPTEPSEGGEEGSGEEKPSE
jgi:hypothetical protein